MISFKVRLLALATFSLSCFVLSTESQLLGKLTSNPCLNKATCHECIQTKDCAWCSEPNYYNKPRCFLEYTQNTCQDSYIHNPQTNRAILMNHELSRTSYAAGPNTGSFGSSSQIVQISPQRASLKLRIGEVHNIQLRYSKAEDYPVDLYYLMDLSKSMEDDKEKLSALGDLLSETLRNITTNFRLGFGSFVDSRISKNQSCDQCEAAPFGFRNHMPLSTDVFKFKTEVKRATVDDKSDASSIGLGSIIQAVACRQQIGWREQARRILVFATDTDFHYASDDKPDGVITPNDGNCHLNTDSLDTDRVTQNDPSISQINQAVIQNSINVIFAVTANQFSVYKKLSSHVEGSVVAVLSNDSSNVVDLVREEYGRISHSIEMKDNATNHVKVTYYSSCVSDNTELETSKCDGLKLGDVVRFTAKIMVTSCPADPVDWNQVIQIYPVGLNESLVIDLEMLCSCDCERPGSQGYEVNSAQCYNHGEFMCGICDCDDMHFGHSCECSTTDMHSEKINDYGCRPDNTTTADCSGRGTCLCGVCDCEKRANMDEVISGRFCECDNFSCERHEQQLCSGPDQGTCECGVCLCKPGWSGSGCSCKTSNDSCISPYGGEICSGHGECVCGKCECKSTEEGHYAGDHCQYCPTCPGRCHELKDCTQCQVYRTGPLKNEEDCRTNCTLFTPLEVNKVEIDENKGEEICIFYDENDCKFKFKYREEENRIVVVAQTERECQTKLFMSGIV